jgi:hypothetical protein
MNERLYLSVYGLFYFSTLGDCTRQTRNFFFVVKGPAADATDAPQPWGLLWNPCDEDEEKDYSIFFNFSKYVAPVE